MATKTAARPAVEVVPPPGTGKNPIAVHPDFPSLRAEWVELTAELATRYLELNERNRPKRDKRIAAMLEDALGGEWEPNGASIVFGLTGEMYDGQHRCEMAVQAGNVAGLLTLVVWGVSEEARKVIDNGAARKAADFLVMSGGVRNATTAAAVARRWYVWQNIAPVDRHSVPNIKPSHSKIINTFEDHQDLLMRAVQYAAWARSRSPEMKRVTTTIWGFSYLIFMEAAKDADTVEFFLGRLVSGEDLKTGDPEYAFRRRMMSALGDREGLGEKDILYLIITAWNTFRGKKRVDKLQLPKNGINSANWPDVY